MTTDANYLAGLRNDLASFSLEIISDHTVKIAEKDAKRELHSILMILAGRSEEITLDNVWDIFERHMGARTKRASRRGWAPRGTIYSVDYFHWMETRMEIALITHWSAYARWVEEARAQFCALDARVA